MSNDLSFDTRAARKEVEDFDKSLKDLTARLEKLDKTGVNKIESELKRLAQTSNKDLTDAALAAEAAGNRLKKAFGSGQIDVSAFAKIKSATDSVKATVGLLAERVEEVKAKQVKAMKEIGAAAELAMASQLKLNAATAQAGHLANTNKLLQERAAAIDLAAAAQARMNAAETANIATAQAGHLANTNKLLQERAAATELAAAAQARMNAAQTANIATAQAGHLANTNKLLQERAAATELAAAAQARMSAAQIANAAAAQTGHLASTNKILQERAAATDLATAAQLRMNAAQTANAAIAQAGHLANTNRLLQERAAAKTAKTADIGSTGQTLGGSEIVGRYSSYDALTKGTKAADNLGNSFKRLALDGNDVHSMARGLASGFNLLWLTWGNLAPLFAGAAISNGFMQTAKTGMQVANTMEIIAVLGGNTASEMQALNGELERIGTTGPFGPLQVAESMKVLSLAGLKANEILSVTQDVLNFSVAGTTDLKTAADTLISVSTAFDMGAGGFGRVSDVVSKAAAESKSSVESFANAMKTASVIHKQYGVSLEDTATGIAALSQLGIEGTSAGTALRNMYSDLSGRSVQVTKILKAQGLEMRDLATGGFRPLLEVVAELNTKLQGLEPIAQKNLMQALLSERGAKGIVEMLSLINKEAKDMGRGLPNALAELRKAIEESYGFAAISAAKMSQTVQAQFDAVKATLQTSMNSAYQSIAPSLSLIADGMRKAFASPEFIENLSSMVTTVAQLALSLVQLTRFVSDHLGVITLAVAAYAGLRLAVSIATTAKIADTAATLVDTAATVANNSAKAGTVAGLAGVARWLPGVGTAVAVVTGLWLAYDFWQSKSKDTALAAANLYTNNVVKNLEDEAKRLKDLNDLRSTGLSLSQAQLVLDGQKARRDAVDPVADVVNSAIRKESAERAKLNALNAEYKNYSASDTAKKVAEQEKAVAAASRATNAAKQTELETLKRVDEAQAAVVRERKRDAQILAAEAEKAAKGFKSGPGTFVLGAGPKGAGQDKSFFDAETVAADNTLTTIMASYNKQKSLAENIASDELSILRTTHSAKLISEEEYQSKLQVMLGKHEEQSLARITKTTADYQAEYEARGLAIAGAMIKAMAKPAVGVNAEKQKVENLSALSQQFENLNNTASVTFETLETGQSKLKSDSYKRITEAGIEAQGVLKKLNEEQEKKSDGAKKYLDSILGSTTAVSDAFKGMEDSLVSFVRTGKLDFSSLADTVITQMMRIAVQQMVMKPFASMFTSSGSSTSAGASAAAGAAGSSLWSGIASIFSAKGNAFDSSGLHAFANGGAFTNQIVDSPTLFPFAKGTGLMGEAGPEAIMPLTRMADGKLGVQSTGENEGGGGGGDTFVINITAIVGDVATKTDVVNGMKATAAQIQASIVRSRTRGGALA